MRRAIRLSDTELALLCEALDSHVYWQLSDESYRRNGFVDDCGSDDPAMRREIRASRRLERKLTSKP